MIDITECAVCGRTIPATTQGCAYCDSERGDEAGEYTPMLMRWIFVLFVLTTVLSSLLAIGSLSQVFQGRAGGGTAVLSCMRLFLAASAGYGVISRRRWAARAAQLYVAMEILAGGLHVFGVLHPMSWSVRAMTPVWAVLFGVFFLRRDVRGRFDRSGEDRAQVVELLKTVSKPDDD